MSERKEFYEYPLRKCYSLHECFFCDRPIVVGDLYYDGGPYGRRCHKECAKLNGDKDEKVKE